jgi:hypothetical protein
MDGLAAGRRLPIRSFAKSNPGKGLRAILPIAASLPEGVWQAFFLITTPATWQVFF